MAHARARGRFVYGRPACDFDEGVDQFVMLFLNALQLKQVPAS